MACAAAIAVPVLLDVPAFARSVLCQMSVASAANRTMQGTMVAKMMVVSLPIAESESE